MRTFYVVAFLLIGFIAQAQIVNIPDPNFKIALLNHNPPIDTNNDGEIQVSEALATQSVDVQNNNITSLEGIESFTNIISLGCANNNLTELDLSQNTQLVTVFCSENQLTSLDLTQSPDLYQLNCADNQLTNVDLSQNPDLEVLRIHLNNLTSLDVSQNVELVHLECFGFSNNIGNLDLSNNVNLTFLSCSGNGLTSLDLSQNTELTFVTCSLNELTSLDVSQNVNLRNLNCRGNFISSLDISSNPTIFGIRCNSNELTSLNLKNGNNISMGTMVAIDNPDLFCIQVDDVIYSNNAPLWEKDASAEYSLQCILGIPGIEVFPIKIWPNPTRNVLNIQSPSPIALIRIYSIAGTLIKETSDLSINVSELHTGLYFVKVSMNGKTLTKKFIKN